MNCEVCGNKFEQSRKSQKYCSKGCKQQAYRERNGIETPEFLKSTKTPEEKVKKEIVTNSVENIMLEIVDKKSTLEAQIMALEERKSSLVKKLVKVESKEPQKAFDKHYQENKDDSFETVLKKIFAAGLMGAVETMGEDITANKKLSQKYKNEISQLDDEILLLQKQVEAININYSTIKKELKEEFERYLEYQSRKEIEAAKSVAKALPAKETIISLDELIETNFQVLEFSDEYADLIGRPEANFKMLIWGLAGNGKSTWALKFANYLATNHGKVLYNSSEEGISQSLKNKVQGIENKSTNLSLSFGKTYTEIENLINAFDFIFIDSINDMSLNDADYKNLIESEKGIVFIGQATKTGTFKGKSIYAHDPDIKIRIDNFIPELEKSRYK